MNKNSEHKKISEWEVLTPSGWQNFDGVKEVEKPYYLEIFFEGPNSLKTNKSSSIKCSGGHQLFVKRDIEENFMFADLLFVGDSIRHEDGNFYPIMEIKRHDVEEGVKLYDLVNVKNGYQYYTNGVISHNCAHVDGIDDLWLGLQPTLSTGGAAILVSSPNGVGNLFHRIWVGAQNKTNDFCTIELPWTVHPERDEEWFKNESKAIRTAKGDRGISQELLCEFLSSGATFLKGEIMDKIYKSIKKPIEIENIGRDEVWIWNRPESGHKYIIGGDVSRGDADDFSAFNIIDTNSDEVVADFKGKLPPDKFGELLIRWAVRYNNALICQELNSVGVAAAIKLKDSGYKNLYYAKFFRNIYMTFTDLEIGDELPGFTTGGNNRTDILAKLENSLRNGTLKVYSKRLYDELLTFIWKKKGMQDKPEAQKGYNDDLVMSLGIGSSLYDAAGKFNLNAEMDMAILHGISRNTQKIDPNAPSTGRTTSDGFFSTPNSARFRNPYGGLTKAQIETHKNRKTHDYNSPFWKVFSDFLKD